MKRVEVKREWMVRDGRYGYWEREALFDSRSFPTAAKAYEAAIKAGHRFNVFMMYVQVTDEADFKRLAALNAT